MDHRDPMLFVQSVAELTKDGELLDGEPFILENDDAVDTLTGLISEARSILGQPEDRAMYEED